MDWFRGVRGKKRSEGRSLRKGKVEEQMNGEQYATKSLKLDPLYTFNLVSHHYQ